MPTRNALYLRRRRASRKQLGLCTTCTEPTYAIRGQSLCGVHAEQQATRQRARELKNQEAGKCRCGRPPFDGSRWCERCTARWNRQLETWHKDRTPAA